jgi:predicted DNA-binding protein (UPF0251 family)
MDEVLGVIAEMVESGRLVASPQGQWHETMKPALQLRERWREAFPAAMKQVETTDASTYAETERRLKSVAGHFADLVNAENEAHESPKELRFRLNLIIDAADEATRWIGKLALKRVDPGAKPNGRKPIKRRPSAKRAKLTMRQAETVQIVGECNGDIAEAARRMGRDRKTVNEHYERAMQKMGKTVVQPKTTGLRRDRRGQEDIANDDDRRT